MADDADEEAAPLLREPRQGDHGELQDGEPSSSRIELQGTRTLAEGGAAATPGPLSSAVEVPKDSFGGLALYAGSTVFVALVSACAKQLGKLGTSVWQIVLARSLTVLLLSTPTLAKQRHGLLGNRRVLLSVRGMLGFGAATCLYLSVQMLPLSDATALTFLAPLAVAVMAPPFIGEFPSKMVWLLLPPCLVGVVLVAKPSVFFGSGEALDPVGVMWGCLQAVLAGAVRVCVRDLRRSESPAVIIFYMAFVSILLAGATAAVLPGGFPFPLPAQVWALFAALGCCGYGNQMCMTWGLRKCKATTASVLQYLQAVWACLLGIVLFGEHPDLLEVLGAILIGGCATALTVAESRKAKREQADDANAREGVHSEGEGDEEAEDGEAEAEKLELELGTRNGH